MNVYAIENECFVKLEPQKNWYSEDGVFFITCDKDEAPELVHVFNFDPQTIEECLSIDQYIKFESLDGYDFCTFNYATYNENQLEFFETNIYVSKKYIILVYDKTIEQMKNVENRVINKKYNLLSRRGETINKIYFLIFDDTVSQYFTIAENIEGRIEDIEKNIMLDYANKEQFQEILNVRTHISRLRKNINSMVYMCDSILFNDNNVITKPMMKYFTNIDIRTNKLYDYSNHLRNMISETRNVYDSKVALKTNDKATLITVIAAFFAPPTVIAGIYGMNFKHMPELDWIFGYPLAILLMLAASGIMYILLKIKKWV